MSFVFHALSFVINFLYIILLIINQYYANIHFSDRSFAKIYIFPTDLLPKTYIFPTDLLPNVSVKRITFGTICTAPCPVTLIIFSSMTVIFYSTAQNYVGIVPNCGTWSTIFALSFLPKRNSKSLGTKARFSGKYLFHRFLA